MLNFLWGFMKRIITFSLLILIPIIIYAKKITVGSSGDYTDLNTALTNAKPGDTVFLLSEKQKVNFYIQNIKGNNDNWITITSNPQNPAVFEGGSTAFQLSDVSYLIISNIIFSGQTANGLNIDDGGSYDTPTHSIIIENCTWLGMNASGNNDELKLSGVDNFEVRYCSFENGAAGGSIIDMVGCHQGKIYGNSFRNAGSNSIQAKGGCSDIDIFRNFFQDGGQRSINIGGSTGLQFFRPPDAKYEAKNIRVFSNQFRGSTAPIAFVGATKCTVANNLLYMPGRWLVRILQENTSAGFVLCSENVFANNICYFNNSANNERGINIGSNTIPNTFDFPNNLWFNTDNTNWNGPNPAVNHYNTILNLNPGLIEYDNLFKIGQSSPAVGKGKKFDFIEYDYFGEKFNDPPSIGPSEGNPPISGIYEPDYKNFNMNFLSLYDFINFIMLPEHFSSHLMIYDYSGKEIYSGNTYIFRNLTLADGIYVYSIYSGTELKKRGSIIKF